MENIKKYCSLLVLILIFCIWGNVTISGKDAENTLIKTPDYPLSEEYISSALKEVQLDWNVVMEESEYKDHHTFSIYDQNNHLIAGIISAGNKKERGLTITTMNRFCNEDSEKSMCAPIRDKDTDKLLNLAVILYGGFEDEQWLIKDFYNNFTVNIARDKNNFSEQYENSDFPQYEWKNNFNDIQYQINSWMTNMTETPEILTIGIYNAGKYIPFTDPMTDDELYEAKLEITYTESSYAPDYPFESNIFLAVNLLSDGNDAVSVIQFNNKHKTYTFDEETSRIWINIKKNSYDEISLEGAMNISQLLILDEKDEIIQKKLFKYRTIFEIPIEN